MLAGTGAGSFHLLNLRYRKTYLDFTIEPHNLPVQMLAPPQDLIKPGDIVSIRVRPEGVHIFDAESGERIDPSPQLISR